MLSKRDIETRNLIIIPNDHPVDRFIFTIIRSTGRKIKKILITKKADIHIKFKPTQNVGRVTIPCQILMDNETPPLYVSWQKNSYLEVLSDLNMEGGESDQTS